MNKRLKTYREIEKFHCSCSTFCDEWWWINLIEHFGAQGSFQIWFWLLSTPTAFEPQGFQDVQDNEACIKHTYYSGMDTLDQPSILSPTVANCVCPGKNIRTKENQSIKAQTVPDHITRLMVPMQNWLFPKLTKRIHCNIDIETIK